MHQCAAIFLQVSTLLWLSSTAICAQNYSLRFDGTNDRVTVPHNNAYNIGTSDFTLEVVVNLNPAALFKEPLISKRTNGSNGFLFISYDFGNRLLLQTAGVGNEVSAAFPSISDGSCHHIAVVRMGSNTTTFYVDGVQKGINTLPHLGINSPGPIYFGYDLVDNNYINGSISEIRFWNTGKTQTEIQTYLNSPVPNNSTGLIGLWRMNERDGQVVADSSMTENDGYLGNSNIADAQDPSRDILCVNGDIIEFVTDVFNSNKNEAIHVSPNPFTDQAKLSLHKPISDGASVQVYAIDGRLIMSRIIGTNNNHLEFGYDFPKGIYLVRVINGSDVTTINIIKD